MKKKKEPVDLKPFKALALQRNPEGKHWAVVELTILGDKVIETNPSNFDLLPYTMSKASAMLQDMVRVLR